MTDDQSAAAAKPDQAEETRQIQRVALYGFLLNLGLAGMKGILAKTSGSLAVAAGAIDSATDSVASAAIYGGLRLSALKSSRFPLGLYKIENLISVFVAFFIFLAGYEVIRRVLFGAGGHPDISLTTIGFLLLAAAAIQLFGRYCLKLGRRTESPTLLAEGKHRQVDVLSSLIVLGAVVMNYLGLHFQLLNLGIDQMAAILVLVFIAKSGWDLLTDGMRVLLDASVDAETLNQVREIIEGEPLVKEIVSLEGRNAGRFRFIQTHIVLRTYDLHKAHRISDRIETRIREKIPHMERVIIHYEPDTSKYRRIALPLIGSEGKLSGHFGEAPSFAIIEQHLVEKNISKQEILENPFQNLERGKGIRVAEWLVQKKVDLVLVQEDLKHKGPGYVFSNAGVEVRTVSAKSLTEALEEEI
ncbi:MAG: cation diffusion facilitator family transporter [Desulfohalobiaceae bacterium]|nr:cation diffusion facilitator family transporter [Desulfohalobiaceae bacterium]